MVGPYRLKDFGLRLPEGAGFLADEDLASMAAARDVYEAERRRGYQEGAAEARREAAAALLAESRQLDDALAAVEAELVALVLSAVRKIVDGFDDVERAEALVRAGLKRLRKARRAELHLPRAIAGELRPRIQALVAENPDIEHVELVESDSLAGSDIVLETAIGRVEGDIAAAVEEVEDLLRRALGKRFSPERAPVAAIEEEGP